MAKTPVQVVDISKALAVSVQNLVDLSATIAAPNTTIVNRAQIADLANDLGVRFGVNRVLTQSIFFIPNEYGPNGEPVSGVVNDVLGTMRFVGSWTNRLDSTGASIEGGVSGDFVEITFYGTGLNSLEVPQSSGGWTSYTVTVDGGSPSTLTNPAQSTVLNGRNATPNQVRNVTSGLTLGIHTAKIVVGSGVAGFAGFEILNDVASSLKINPGSYFVGGQRLQLVSQQSSVYNTTFESGTLGTKGGHVLVYQKSDGSIAKAVTPTDVTSLTLASADHTNEEPLRTYYSLEFGASRSANDDWSSITASSNNKAFTLDDGVQTLIATTSASSAGYITSLAGKPLGASFGAVGVSANGFLTLTFIGTGLDIFLYDGANGGNDQFQFAIDGGGLVNWPYTAGSTIPRVQKIVSGLPYGTHVFRLVKPSTANTWLPVLVSYIVYGPKTPTLPSGAVALSDYFICADYVANTTAGTFTKATGVVSKMNTREFTYTGTWAAPTVDSNSTSGWFFQGNTNGGTLKYVFYGTGFELRANQPSSTVTATVSVDGATNLSGFTTGVYGAGMSFTATTGALSIAASGGYGQGLKVSNLALGVHTLLVTLTSTNGFNFESLDVITPIHSPKSNVYADLQNTLLIGSQSVSDMRSLVANFSVKKNVSSAIGVTSGPTTSSTAPVLLPDMAVVHRNSSGKVRVTFQAHSRNSSANQNDRFQLFVDGLPISQNYFVNDDAGTNVSHHVSIAKTIDVSPGVHHFMIMWFTSGGTANSLGLIRELTVEEA